jgi:CheY-like chemotaxis protein
MQILIVDDDANLREILVRWFQILKPNCTVFEASCLDEALEQVPQVDGVFCDGTFPTHRTTASEPEQTMTGNWAPVAQACREHDKPFVLFTGSEHLVMRIRQALGSVPMHAFLKPMEVRQALLTLIDEVERKMAAAKRELGGHGATYKPEDFRSAV